MIEWSMSHPPGPTFRTPAAHGHGLVLLGLLLAVGLILFLMFGRMGGTSYADQIKKTRDNGRETARKIRTEQMSLLIAMYRQTNSKLPKVPADLESPGAFNDGWGKEMTFTFTDRNGKMMITYHSAGSDGVVGNTDDVTYEDSVPY